MSQLNCTRIRTWPSALAVLAAVALACAPVGAQPVQGGQAPAAVSAAAPERQITWAVKDWPPVMILNNGLTPTTSAQLGRGWVDRMLAEIIARMPQYRHSFQLMNRQRILGAMQGGQPVCDPSTLKTAEREQWAVFTPAMPIPPVSLVLRAQSKAAITRGAPMVSLDELALRKEVSGRFEAKRSYGTALDQILLREGDNLSAEVVSRPGQLTSLVAKGRYDYTLEYPMVVEYLQQQEPSSTPLDTVPLKEAQQWTVNFVGCTRGAWGDAVIRDVDAAIRAAASAREYREALHPWLPAAYLQKNRARMTEFFDERARR